MNYYVHASNIHTDESERYGPFAGYLVLTYAGLSIGEGGDTIATYHEDWDDQDWLDQDGVHRVDGWRMQRTAWDRPRLDAQGNFQGRRGHGEAFGPCWTDLYIEPTNDDPIDRETQWDRIEEEPRNTWLDLTPKDRPTPTTTEGAW